MVNLYSYVEQNKLGAKKNKDQVMATTILKFEVKFK